MEGFLSRYFLLNSEIMGVKINDLGYETENMYAGGFIASDSGGLYVIRTSEYFKELNTQPIPAILKEHLRAKYVHKISAIKEDDNPVLIYLKNTKHNTR